MNYLSVLLAQHLHCFFFPTLVWLQPHLSKLITDLCAGKPKMKICWCTFWVRCRLRILEKHSRNIFGTELLHVADIVNLFHAIIIIYNQSSTSWLEETQRKTTTDIGPLKLIYGQPVLAFMWRGIELRIALIGTHSWGLCSVLVHATDDDEQ